jgi:hypothetical protein
MALFVRYLAIFILVGYSAIGACAESLDFESIKTWSELQVVVPDDWIKDQNGCAHFVASPEPGESVEWTGKCVNGLASGYGKRVWISKSRPNVTEFASLTLGISTGDLGRPYPRNAQNIIRNAAPQGCKLTFPIVLAASAQRLPKFAVRFTPDCSIGTPITAEIYYSGFKLATYDGELYSDGGGYILRRGPKDLDAKIYFQNGKLTFFNGVALQFPKVALQPATAYVDLEAWIPAITMVNRGAGDSEFKLLKDTFDRFVADNECEKAETISAKHQPDKRFSFNNVSCLSDRKYANMLRSRNVQEMYLAAGLYESDGERGRAKRIYVEIMNRFPKDAIALRAADRLTRLSDVEAVESSNSAASSRLESMRNEERQRSSSACFSRISACESSCDPIRDVTSRVSCKDRCRSICSR